MSIASLLTAAIDPTSAAHNYVTVNGLRSPGRAALTGVKAPYNWDILPGYGFAGATTIFRGRGIAKPLLTLSLWKPEHFLAWPAFAKVLEPPKLSRPLVVQMSHPLLSAADISAVSVESIGQPERQSNGIWLASIQLLEFRPPKPALLKPRGAIPDTKGVPIPPKTEADRALIAQVQRLSDARKADR